MRNSDWQITWDPAGASPLVLLDHDDLMDAEIRLPREARAVAGKSDFALRVSMLPGRNRRTRLEFSRRAEHATAAQSWAACLAALAAAPWGLKGVLRIAPRGGTARNYSAALLSSGHRPATDGGIIESVHRYAFRLVPI